MSTNQLLKRWTTVLLFILLVVYYVLHEKAWVATTMRNQNYIHHAPTYNWQDALLYFFQTMIVLAEEIFRLCVSLLFRA